MASFISQLTDAMNLCSQPVERQVRTTIDPPMAPEEAMKLLKDRKGQASQNNPKVCSLFVLAPQVRRYRLVGNALARACLRFSDRNSIDMIGRSWWALQQLSVEQMPDITAQSSSPGGQPSLREWLSLGFQDQGGSASAAGGGWPGTSHRHHRLRRFSRAARNHFRHHARRGGMIPKISKSPLRYISRNHANMFAL